MLKTRRTTLQISDYRETPLWMERQVFTLARCLSAHSALCVARSVGGREHREHRAALMSSRWLAPCCCWTESRRRSHRVTHSAFVPPVPSRHLSQFTLHINICKNTASLLHHFIHTQQSGNHDNTLNRLANWLASMCANIRNAKEIEIS